MWRLLISFSFSTLIGLLLAAPAYAQDSGVDEGMGALLLLPVSTVGGLTTTTGGVILTIVLTNKKKKKALNWYIRDNAVALKQEITVGGGDTLYDVAQLFGVPRDQHRQFATAMATHRVPLVDLIGSTPIDDERTEQFMDIVWDAIAADDQLATTTPVPGIRGS